MDRIQYLLTAGNHVVFHLKFKNAQFRHLLDNNPDVLPSVFGIISRNLFLLSGRIVAPFALKDPPASSIDE
jgi:hypothetical protein